MELEKHQNLDTVTIKISVCEFKVAANRTISFEAVCFGAFLVLKRSMLNVRRRQALHTRYTIWVNGRQFLLCLADGKAILHFTAARLDVTWSQKLLAI
jgi:hypothetical protein